MGIRSLLRDPKKQIGLVTFGFLIWYLILVNKTGGLRFADFLSLLLATVAWIYRVIGVPGPDPAELMPASISAIIGDLWVFGFIFALGAAFFAQFVLPLRNVPERMRAVTRLFAYVMRRHGPAISIANGIAKLHTREIDKVGPGVILLDTASAAVLRIPTKFTRAVGPGIVFTRRRETIANAFSLYRQAKLLGPRFEEDPFAVQEEHETAQEFQQRRARRFETSGTTRDGVEVVPTLITIFRLNNKPDAVLDPAEAAQPVYTRFGLNRATLWKANGKEGIDPKKGNDTQQRNVRWDWLPAFMSAELWREYLEKFKLEQLFARPGEQVDETALQSIESYMNLRLKNARVEHLNEFGKPSGRGKEISQEYMRLQERGLEVIITFVAAMHFPHEVETSFVEQWRDRWKDQANDQYLKALDKRSGKRLEGEELALRQFAENASSELGTYLLENAPTPDKAPTLTASLELLVQGTRNQILTDVYLRPRITNENQDLLDLIEWIRRSE